MKEIITGFNLNTPLKLHFLFTNNNKLQKICCENIDRHNIPLLSIIFSLSQKQKQKKKSIILSLTKSNATNTSISIIINLPTLWKIKSNVTT